MATLAIIPTGAAPKPRTVPYIDRTMRRLTYETRLRSFLTSTSTRMLVTPTSLDGFRDDPSRDRATNALYQCLRNIATREALPLELTRLGSYAVQVDRINEPPEPCDATSLSLREFTHAAGGCGHSTRDCAHTH